MTWLHDVLPSPPPVGARDSAPRASSQGGVPTPAQGGPLLVTPAGSTLVATDRMHAHVEQLASLEHQLSSTARSLVSIDEEVSWAAVPAAPAGAVRSELDLAAAIRAGHAAHRTAEHLVRALRHAIRVYDDAETEALARADRLAAFGGAELGVAARAALPAVAVLGALGWLASKVPDPGGIRAAGVRRFLLEHPGLITGPDFVQGVRAFTDGLDEGTSTFLGIPVPVALLLGATGATGVRTSARGLLAVGPLVGLFRETPVTVDRVATTRIASPAVGAVQRLERVPEVDQVRIEKYDAPGRPSRFVVYVGPTETFSPVADHEPWDLTSNVGGVGGLDVGAFRASEIAMRDAGVSPSSQVQFVGFSQGGLIASMLAASGDWNAAGIQTFGAPTGNIAMPSGLDGMAVRNTDDFIPMLAGPQLDHQLLQVERRAFADGVPLPTYHAAPAHQRDAYLATAAVVDAATSSAVRTQSDALDAFTGDYASRPGSSIVVTSYHAARVPDAGSPLDLTQLELHQVTPEAPPRAR